MKHPCTLKLWRGACVALILFSFVSSAWGCNKTPHAPFDKESYYSGISATLDAASLREALNLKIKDHTAYAYSPCVWHILADADRDPKNIKHVIGIYTRRSIPMAERDRGANTPDAWNREHAWPKSHGFPSHHQHAHNDAHAIFASDKSVNADRGNLDYGEGIRPHFECTDCMIGNDVWEPPDEVKGDLARALFYMDVRYEGNDHSGVGDLTLVNRNTSVSELALGKLCTLVRWHHEDPVSAEERTRLDVIYSWQGNRNPFIDHPGFVATLFGPKCEAGVHPTVTNAEQTTPTSMWILVLIAMLVIWQGLKQRRR